MNRRIDAGLWLTAAATCVWFAFDPLHRPLPVFASILAVLAAAALVRGGTARRLARLVRVEFTKLICQRVFQYGLGTTALITLASALLHERLDGETGWALAAASIGTGFWASEVFVLVLGATAIAGELGQGTLKMILPHAYRRSEWIAAKAVMLALASTIFAATVTIVAGAHAGATLGFEDVVKEIPAGFGEQQGSVEVFRTAGQMHAHLEDVVYAGLASLLATAMIGLLFSTLFDTVVAALSASFLLFLGLESADVLLGLPRDVLQKIYASYPDQLREWTMKLGRGLNETWDPATLGTGVGLALLTGAGAWLLAAAWFDRHDLHG